ncbi:MAG: hypothetical protein ABS70_00730 [Nitrospira sp. SCN 59-13]|nr:MAG: hypothetical protein ABS70_00730 [Nitrospira sp. SCN 59-13]
MLVTSLPDTVLLNAESAPPPAQEPVCEKAAADKPLVSVIIPAFNEAVMLPSTLARVCGYMGTLEGQYRWEIIVVNDGSSDRTADVAEEFAKTRKEIRIVHHHRNRGLGQALRTGFESSLGRYVVVLDCDLSYAPDHVGRLLDQIQRTQATIVVASPYADGGLVSHVPWLRRMMSRWANRFLASFARCNLSTLTGMVRVYDGPFIRAVSLRARGQEISPEIIYKGMLLRAHIEEIPGHLDWRLQHEAGSGRRSSRCDPRNPATPVTKTYRDEADADDIYAPLVVVVNVFSSLQETHSSDFPSSLFEVPSMPIHGTHHVKHFFEIPFALHRQQTKTDQLDAQHG